MASSMWEMREELRGLAWFVGAPLVAVGAALYLKKPIYPTLIAKPLATLAVGAAHCAVTYMLSQGGTLSRRFHPDMTGKVAIVTGGNNGIGYRVAHTLAGWGATVVIGCRNVEAGTEAANQILRDLALTETPNRVRCLRLDLASQTSVHAFAGEWVKLGYNKLDILCNNAGVMLTPFGTTAEGIEIQFGTNHIGHFLLTKLLRTYVEAASGRVVCVTSAGHAVGGDRLDYAALTAPVAQGYDAGRAYGASKVANIMHARKLNRELKNGATAYSVHPGIVRTNLTASSLGNFGASVYRSLTFLIQKSPQSGADAVLYCCCHPDAQPGAWHKDCRTATPFTPFARDDAEADRLWEESERMLRSMPQ